jgi:two-component system cell cycle sensor histidine kinase/response regulator CckA
MTAAKVRSTGAVRPTQALTQRLAEAEAIIEALLSGQIDAVVDSRTHSPVLLSKAQDALRESEERFRRIVETANEGIWTIDTDERITFVNPRLIEMLGFPASEMIGKSFFEFIPDAAIDPATLRVDRSRRGISEEIEARLLRSDGSELWVFLKSSPIRDTEGKYVGTLSMMTDRTRHREDVEALRKSEEQYRQIVETTTEGIVKSDWAGRILFVNRRYAEMLGYETDEMIGASLFDFMGPAARIVAQEAFKRRKQGVRDVVDTVYQHKNGSSISVNIAGAPLFDGEGKYVGNLGVVRDVTEQKALQAQLMVSDRMASVGTLAAGVAHEINNPLAAVIANLDYIAESLRLTIGDDATGVTPLRSDAWLLEEIKTPLDDAREAAQRVRFIVRDLKIFSRSQDGEERGPVNVEGIMESSLRMAWNEIRHRATLVKLYGRVPVVEANEARLGQVFLNLVVNAAQALPAGQAESNQIRVTTRLDGERVVIEVADTGAGIPPNIIGRIFDAFFTTKAVGVGTGLGLAICQRIVTDRGGTLTV